MKKTHFYLVDTSSIIPGAAVSALQFNIIKEEPFIVHDLQVRIYDPFASLVILEILYIISNPLKYNACLSFYSLFCIIVCSLLLYQYGMARVIAL